MAPTSPPPWASGAWPSSQSRSSPHPASWAKSSAASSGSNDEPHSECHGPVFGPCKQANDDEAPRPTDRLNQSATRVFIIVHAALIIFDLLILSLWMFSGGVDSRKTIPTTFAERFDHALPTIGLLSILYSVIAPRIARRLNLLTILGSAALTVALLFQSIIDPRNSRPFLWLLYAVPVTLPALFIACRSHLQRSKS